MNLERAAAINRAYVRENVHLNVTISSPDDLEDMISFVRGHPLLSELRVMPAFLKLMGTKVQLDDPVGVWRSPARDRYLEGLCYGDLSGLDIEHAVFSPALQALLPTFGRRIGSEVVRDSVCSPGTDLGRLFVSCDGAFRPCESTFRMPTIGNLDDGFDHVAVNQMKHELLSSTAGCDECWAVRMCGMCYLHLYRDPDTPDEDYKAASCDDLREQLDRALVFFTEVNERKPGAWPELARQFFSPSTRSSDSATHSC
jgi:uncharacterized protein